MKPFQPAALYIETAVKDHRTTQAILEKLPGIEVHEIDNYQVMGFDGFAPNARFKLEKSALILAEKKGELVKEVQRDLFREIPDEFYIIHSFGCPFDCQYCFLFDYLQHQIPTIFVNLEDLIESIQSTVEARPGGTLTFHAGEFSDALAYDHLTDLSKPLVELFATYPDAWLELRTKSNQIENLLGLDHRTRTTVSWTFSPQRVVQLFEYRTATAMERIEAARRCQDAGYPVALRLDPIVRFPGWEQEYRALIENMARALDPKLIKDCHMGVFRYTPGLGKVIKSRFPNSRLRLEESVPSVDGKYRYFKPLRVEMYRQIIQWLTEFFPNLKIELCMDSPEVEESLSGLLN